jgi:hypothetical protein
MGKVHRGGYVFEWWIGDHPPRHVHVSDSNGKLLGRSRWKRCGHLMIGNRREKW